jgi:DNA-directed RNA polymerase subunit RPC12/RpoP
MTGIDPGYIRSMRDHGFSEKTVCAVRKIKCPECGFEFSLTYARTIACRGCPHAVTNCPMVRCAKCDHEFFLKEFEHIGNKLRQRLMSEHMANVVDDYINSMGWKKGR